MGSLIFTQAVKLRRNAKKMRGHFEESGCPELAEQADQAYDLAIKNGINEFRETMLIAVELKKVYEEIVEKAHQWYFITIRPDERSIKFPDFYYLVDKFLKRKCIKSFTLTFEQKGVTKDTVGSGFHAHIVCDGTWASRGQCLRDTQSTFSKCTAPNCVQVKTTRNPDDIVEKYLKEYESEDGHKEITKETDKIWRENLRLQDTYTMVPLPTIALSSSPGQSNCSNTISKKTVVVSLA